MTKQAVQAASGSILCLVALGAYWLFWACVFGDLDWIHSTFVWRDPVMHVDDVIRFVLTVIAAVFGAVAFSLGCALFDDWKPKPKAAAVHAGIATTNELRFDRVLTETEVTEIREAFKNASLSGDKYVPPRFDDDVTASIERETADHSPLCRCRFCVTKRGEV